MKILDAQTTVKVIGANGQISLGKEFAGRPVIVETREPGVWTLRTAAVIPDNEAWLHTPKAIADLGAAAAYAISHPPARSDLDALKEKVANGGKGKRKTRSTRS